MKWHSPSQGDGQRYAPAEVFAAGLRHHHIANTAYPIHHSQTMKPYRVHRGEFESVAARAWQGVEELGLYVHVPFCQGRCAFCEYTVIDSADNQKYEERYFDLLLAEMELYRALLGPKTLIGFDIGGGTPALVRVENIERVVRAARSAFRFRPGVVISIETTPSIAAKQPEKIAALRHMGIERISMGVQTTQLALANKIGREYKGFASLQRAASHIRAAGFSRFNIDLMYGFAGQSVDDWRGSVEKSLELDSDYITLYQMRYKGTKLQAQANEVSKETIAEMVAAARARLLAAGYAATPGKNTYSRIPGDVGASDYLTHRVIRGTPYLGLGLGAQSLTHTTLAYNQGAASKTIPPYERAVQAGQLPIQDLYDLPLVASMAKMISVSFYFGEINLDYFERKFGTPLEAQFPQEVAFVLERGLMEYRNGCLGLTDDGVKAYNGVIALFYAPAVKAHLLQRPVGFQKHETV